MPGVLVKRIVVFSLLAVLYVASSRPMEAQNKQVTYGHQSAKQAQKEAAKQQKQYQKAASKQQKAIEKYQRKQQKAANKAVRKANKNPAHYPNSASR